MLARHKNRCQIWIIQSSMSVLEKDLYWYFVVRLLDSGRVVQNHGSVKNCRSSITRNQKIKRISQCTHYWDFYVQCNIYI